MTATISDWANLAFNQVPDSGNRIHSDEIATAYGYTGALVPGVTVSAYLIHPAIEAWGLDWLTRGHAHVTVKSPLYDHAPFEVVTRPDGNRYGAELHSEERLCAIADVELPAAATTAPDYRGDPLLDDDYEAPEATRPNMEALQQSGCRAKRFRWNADQHMATYLRDASSMPALLRADASSGTGGYANASFLLGCANRHFASVASMNPWIHLETRHWNHQPVELGTELVSEMVITGLFSRKGHEFADCTFNLFRDDTKACVCSIEQRAIYRMRPAGR